jgi:putative ABC transport system permease protein
VKGAAETVIVNENLAQRFWPNQDPIGKRLERGDKEPWRTVVGVVKDSKEFSVDNEPPISIYHPHEQIPIPTMFLVVRSSSDPSQLISSINKEIQSLDPEIPAFEVKSMSDRVAESLGRRRFSTFLLGVFAVVALLLSVIGIYGVIAYSVSQRTQEIGIRMALGAAPAAILQMILRQSLTLVIVGICFGLMAAFGLTRLMSSLLFGVSQTDFMTFAVPPVVLLVVALVASFLPARRAGSVDPVTALRSE